MPIRRPRFHLVDIVMFTALVAVVVGFLRWMATPRPLGSGDGTAVLFSAALGVVVGIWSVSRAMRWGPECVECGRRFVPTDKSASPLVCPRCRWRSVSPAKTRREMPKNLAKLAFVLLIIVFLVGVAVYSHGTPFGPEDWFTVPLMAVGLAFGGAGLLFAVSVAFLSVRTLLGRREGSALARAKKVARTEGEEVVLGPIALWHSGPSDPSPMIANEAEVIRRRFDAFTGEAVEARPPLRLLVFEKREHLVELHRQPITDLWNLDALFTPRLASMTTGLVPYRLGDAARMARSMAAYHALVAYKGVLPPFWLQQGIAAAIVTDGEGSDRLNRRMLVAIERGSALGVELFSLKPPALMRLVRGWYEHAKFARWEQIQGQSRSLIEYLNGPKTPDDRRRAFRAFFKELGRPHDAEAVFRHHFGHGFDGLIASWRDWVRERGVGMCEPPPAAVDDALTSRIIPLVADRAAKFRDRLHAIREMGRSGSLRGVDTLIALLVGPVDETRQDVVWALESISGHALGPDHRRWLAWWDGLPAQAQEAHAGSPLIATDVVAD